VLPDHLWSTPALAPVYPGSAGAIGAKARVVGALVGVLGTVTPTPGARHISGVTRRDDAGLGRPAERREADRPIHALLDHVIVVRATRDQPAQRRRCRSTIVAPYRSEISRCTFTNGCHHLP